jgi:signal transduction histidine kinase
MQNKIAQELTGNIDVNIAKALTWRYVIALVLIATLSTAAWFSLHFVIAEQQNTAAVVNVSGRQRMLSQRTAFYSNLLMTVPRVQRPPIRVKLKEAIDLMSRSHRGLIHGDSVMGLPENMSSSVHAMYFDGSNALDPQVLNYIKTVEELIDEDDETLIGNPHWQYITMTAPSQLLTSLDNVVKQYQLEGETSVRKLARAEMIFWLLTLLLLLMEALLIFHPFIKSMKDVIEKLKLRDVQQKSLVDELTVANLNLKQAQSQLIQSEKMAAVGQLAAGVAHEINNPIGFVNSNLGSLSRYSKQLFDVIDRYEIIIRGQPALSQNLDEIRAVADLNYLREDTAALITESMDGMDRVKRIVQSLKDFAHPAEEYVQEEDLLLGLECTLNVVLNEIKYKADVVRELTPLPKVSCIIGQINQVFMNLLVNAAQSIENHGTITLRSGTEEGGVWIEISDTGYGMTEDVKKRIFEPFFTTKPIGKGTGLGLSVTWDIINKHGGRIGVKSELGIGTTFHLWLPAK